MPSSSKNQFLALEAFPERDIMILGLCKKYDTSILSEISISCLAWDHRSIKRVRYLNRKWREIAFKCLPALFGFIDLLQMFFFYVQSCSALFPENFQNSCAVSGIIGSSGRFGESVSPCISQYSVPPRLGCLPRRKSSLSFIEYRFQFLCPLFY